MNDVAGSYSLQPCRCAEAYLRKVDTWQKELQSVTGQTATIFTASMGAKSADGILRQISCQ